MYLHLGEKTIVALDDVVGIFDLETATISKNTREYLKMAEKNSDVINVTLEMPKSFIVCSDKTRASGRRVYISQISALTLLKRAGYIDRIKTGWRKKQWTNKSGI
ncbi:MAG TPA: DUF370 domain-containing protein [Ruminococcaceae bacterium]|nr:DUF370 domain-containing protein [Oscillospiraceae bacterium]